MLRTRLCDLLGIEHPIIQASLGPWSSAEVVAAVSNAGGLGSFGAVLKPADELRGCYEPVTRMPVACWRKRHANATK